MTDVKSIDDLFKEGLLKKGDDPSLIVNRVPTGIALLDELLGGGVPLGRFLSSFGEESMGKTLLAQIFAASIQKTDKPLGLYMDMERSYDEKWWKLSGVDTEKLIVSTPVTAEQAIDIMVSMVEGSKELGFIILDSLGAMIPAPVQDPEKSAEDKTIGLQAKAITLMYAKLSSLIDQHKIAFIAINQMRDNIGGHNDIGALPGGKAHRHYTHVMLKIRRDTWIIDNASKKRLGFVMEITSRKNKISSTSDGTIIKLPFMFDSQLDWTLTYLEDGIKAGYITKKTSHYGWGGKSYMGMQNLRQFFSDNPEELELLKTQLGV